MDKTRFFILNIFIALLQCGYSQTTQYNDKIYLKNETRLVGKIIQYSPTDSVKIELKNGQIIALTASQITKVMMGETKVREDKPYYFKERGLYNVSYFGLSFGKTEYNNAVLGASISNTTGYQFNRWIGAGLGVGLDNQYVTGANMNILSTFVEVRGYLSPKNRTFYYSTSGGVGFPMVNKEDEDKNFTGHRGDFMFHPALGLRLGANSDFNFFIDFGAKFQRIHFDQLNNWAENRYTITYRRWVLRGGIVF